MRVFFYAMRMFKNCPILHKGTFLFLILLSIGAGKGLYILKDGFSPRRIQSLEYAAEENWGEEAAAALKKTYHYIGRGRQCFAFASDDEKYVLKFPRTDIYKTPFWARVLPVKSYRENLEKSHREREAFLLNSFKISFEELKNQTALLAVHIGKSRSNGLMLHLVDAAGCKHHLPLSTTSFVLQYKRPILMKAFSDALEKKDQKEAQKILDALLTVIAERARKGILNRDRSFLRNYGFDGENAYQIDIGSFFRSPLLEKDTAFQKSVRDSIDPVQEWLSLHSPEMLEYLNLQLKERFHII